MIQVRLAEGDHQLQGVVIKGQKGLPRPGLQDLDVLGP